MAVHLFMPHYFYKVFRKKRQLFYLRNLKLMFHRSTRSLLRNGFLLGGHTLGGVAVAHHAALEDGLKPCAGSSVATIKQIEVVAVAVHSDTDRRGASVLYGCARGHDNVGMDVLYHLLQRTIDGVIHLLLAVAVALKAAVVGVLRIRPGLVKHYLHIFLGMCFHISHKL